MSSDMYVTHPPMDEDTHRHGEDESITSQSNGIGHPLFQAAETPLASDAEPSEVSDSGYNANSEASADEYNTESDQSLRSAEQNKDDRSAIAISTAQITLDPPQLLSHEQRNMNSGPIEHVAPDHSLSPDADSEVDIENFPVDVCETDGFYWSEDRTI